jgi:hypothetical protein
MIMNEAETPKTPREEWEEVVRSSGLFKRTPEDRKLVMELDDEIIKIALDSSDSMVFHDRVKRIDPSIGWTFKPDTMPRKYLVACEFINERARNRIDQEEQQQDAQAIGNNFFKSLIQRLRRKLR